MHDDELDDLPEEDPAVAWSDPATDPEVVEGYWTAERMSDAIPAETEFPENREPPETEPRPQEVEE